MLKAFNLAVVLATSLIASAVASPVAAQPNAHCRALLGLPNGDPVLSAGAQMTALQVAKMGELMRNGGEWSGRKIIDEDALRSLFQGRRANAGYGAGWWLPRNADPENRVARNRDILRHAEALPQDLVLAAGSGGQRLYVIPSRQLTVVRLAAYDPKVDPASSDRSDTSFLKLLLR